MRRRCSEVGDCTVIFIVGTSPVASNVKPSKLRVEELYEMSRHCVDITGIPLLLPDGSKQWIDCLILILNVG